MADEKNMPGAKHAFLNKGMYPVDSTYWNIAPEKRRSGCQYEKSGSEYGGAIESFKSR